MDIGRIDPKFTPTSRHGPLGRAEQFQDSVTLVRGQKVKKGLCVHQAATRLVGEWDVSRSEKTGRRSSRFGILVK